MMIFVDLPFWVVVGITSGFIELRVDVILDVRSVRYCMYADFLNQPLIFLIKVHGRCS